MANKTWNYLVKYVNPEDLEKTPAKRGECTWTGQATSAKRAISKATKDILEDWDMKTADLVILDAVRDI